jgi:drug/metabolite transporter (DMT)-like permease
MIVSTAISFLCHQKPSKRELLSVLLSFLGVLCLVLIPEVVLGKIS